MTGDKPSITADTLEMSLLNQTDIRPALEDLSRWISQRGSIHDNIMAALRTLDTHAEAILIGIERLQA